MNTIHMTNADWQQYLETLPEGDPTEWLNDLVNAFTKQWIDYFDIHIALQTYGVKITGNKEYEALLADAWRRMKKENGIQEHGRVVKYHDNKKFQNGTFNKEPKL